MKPKWNWVRQAVQETRVINDRVCVSARECLNSVRKLGMRQLCNVSEFFVMCFRKHLFMRTRGWRNHIGDLHFLWRSLPSVAEE